MSFLSQTKTSARRRHTISMVPTLANLRNSLRLTQTALIENIEAEEIRTHIRDQNDAHYSLLARSMRRRLENLQTTIAKIEAELVARDQQVTDAA